MSEQSFEVDDSGDTNRADGSGESDTEQLTAEDTLLDRGLEDPLDEGYSPPDYEPNTKIPTESEEAEGLSLDELLAAETPDVDVLAADEDDNEFEALELGSARAGRIVDTGDGSYDDNEKALVGDDVGFSGGGASAEEAAMHIFDPDGTDNY